jgi:hypothetical protein
MTIIKSNLGIMGKEGDSAYFQLLLEVMKKITKTARIVDLM